MSNHFFELSTLPERIEEGTSLDTVVLEQEMQTNNGGIDIADPHQNYVINEEFLRQFVPHFHDDRSYPTEKEVLTIAGNYPDIKRPCSILVDSVQDIQDLMTVGYQVAHFHYILGKKHNIKNKFPKKCCGISSRNLMLSLIEFGYPNAAYVYSQEFDHGYVVLPFVLQNENIRGTIIIDPTSDQLWKDTNIRNAVFVKLGKKWEYRTDWEDGANLFPDRICSIDILRKIPDEMSNYSSYHRGGKKYFKKAFANPLPIPINREQIFIQTPF